jgi:hypothetical protein
MTSEPERKRRKADSDDGGGVHEEVPDEIWLSILRHLI